MIIDRIAFIGSAKSSWYGRYAHQRNGNSTRFNRAPNCPVTKLRGMIFQTN